MSDYPVVTTTIEANDMSFTADLGGDPSDELVIMLHGFPQTRYTWRHEMQHLASHGYRVCAYDQRGYSPGARPEGIEAYAINLLVEEVFSNMEMSLNEGVGAVRRCGAGIRGWVELG